MSEQENGKVTTLQRPTTDDLGAWRAYWKAQGQPWRMEQEIDVERQKYLAERRAIVPDIKQGIYPFKGIKLHRADVEWLLATHENGRGPVDWSDERQRKREGIDLRGAHLEGEDLIGLPLAKMWGGVNWFEPESVLVTSTLLKEAEIYLQGAYLDEAHLEGALLFRAHLEGSHLQGTYLKQAILYDANLTKATLYAAHVEDANLSQAYLQGAMLTFAHFERTPLHSAHLEGADLAYTHFEGADLYSAHLEGAKLNNTFFDGATRLNNVALSNKQDGNASIVDVQWGNANIAVIDWSAIQILGDEVLARRRQQDDGKTKDTLTKINQNHEAVRANRLLSVALRNQGLNEEADRFGYRAQKLQRTVSRLQKKFGQYLFSLFLDGLAGYGYRPGRSVIWYLIIITGFALVYHLLGGLSLFPPDAFVFSIMSFHGRGFFPSLSNETNLHNPLVMLAAVEAIVGLFIEISFIATFTQRFFGR